MNPLVGRLKGLADGKQGDDPSGRESFHAGEITMSAQEGGNRIGVYGVMVRYMDGVHDDAAGGKSLLGVCVIVLFINDGTAGD